MNIENLTDKVHKRVNETYKEKGYAETVPRLTVKAVLEAVVEVRRRK